MVDTKEFVEGQFLTVEVVKESPSKKLVVLNEGEVQEVEFNNRKSKRLTLKVEIDGKQKLWRPNKDSIKNMQQLGLDSKFWNGSVVDLRIVNVQGRECILAMPQIKATSIESVNNEQPKVV